MDQETEQLITDSFKQLPPELQKAIAAMPLSTITQDIANKNQLHIDKSGALYTETLLVLLGIEKISSLGENIKTALLLDDALTQSIVNELNERVFKEVRKFLQDSKEPQTPVEQIPPQVTVVETPAPVVSKLPENPERARTLADIENPKPVTPPITIPDIQRGPQKPWEATKQQITADFNVSKQQNQTNQNNNPDPYKEQTK